MNKILFIGAHPDDVELGCAGTINKYINEGCDVKVVVLAEGTSARYANYNSNSAEIITAIKQRQKKCIKSLNNLGVEKYSFYDLPCCRLNTVPLLKINKIIENEICAFKPNQIYTHSGVDANLDHRIVFESTKIATRPSAFPSLKSVFCYEVLSSSENTFSEVFKPNVFVALSKENLLKKKESLKFYDTEMRTFPDSRSIKGVEVLATFRGMQINEEFAEAFELLRTVV